MCGILGIASREPVREREIFGRMRDTLAHRGPDDAGEWWSADGRVGFEHRRLAIIDLSQGGHQPMAAAAGAMQIVLNGEIYNYRELKDELREKGHRFDSASDTEVVLAAYCEWGSDCLSHLVGMFAFGLYDADTRTVMLARDRAGERPLFYRHAAGQLLFASELKAMLAHPSVPRTISVEALHFYLAYGYVPGELCIFEGFRKLPPAHALQFRFDDGSVKQWRYWDLPDETSEADAAPAPVLIDELEQLLEDSVRRQLVADVPVGVLLSGGLDSSLVTALAARASGRPVKTFTMVFPGHDVDESRYAAIVARHFGTDHEEIVAEPSTFELLPLLARQYDEPIADSSMLPTYLVSRAIRRHATVALGGDGGDELFGGYPHYRMLQAGEDARRLVPGVLRSAAASAASRLPFGFRGRNYIMGFSADLAHRIAHVNLYFDAATRRRLLRPLGPQTDEVVTSPERHRASLCNPGFSIVRQAAEADFKTTMVDGYLVKVDRASMLNALEVRAPFLDHCLVEFAFSRVPASLKATTRETKVLLRALGRRILPPELELNRKQGFSLPLAAWFRGSWGEQVAEVLMSPGQKIFDHAVVREVLDGQRRGYANAGRLFALTFFELWRREYGAEIADTAREETIAAKTA